MFSNTGQYHTPTALLHAAHELEWKSARELFYKRELGYPAAVEYQYSPHHIKEPRCEPPWSRAPPTVEGSSVRGELSPVPLIFRGRNVKQQCEAPSTSYQGKRRQSNLPPRKDIQEGSWSLSQRTTAAREQAGSRGTAPPFPDDCSIAQAWCGGRQPGWMHSSLHVGEAVPFHNVLCLSFGQADDPITSQWH